MIYVVTYVMDSQDEIALSSSFSVFHSLDKARAYAKEECDGEGFYDDDNEVFIDTADGTESETDYAEDAIGWHVYSTDFSD